MQSIRRSFGKAIAVVTPAAAIGTMLLAGSAPADTNVSALTRSLDQERAGVSAVGVDRLEALTRVEPPMPRQAASVETVRATRNAPEDGRWDVAALDAMPEASGDAEWHCLATAIYFEARGEPLAGQIAVAEVILNRVEDRRYPGTICAVTNQGVGSGRACQFSYACDGRSDVMRSNPARERSKKLATVVLDGRAAVVTDGATHFHATYVRPTWSRTLARTAAIGNHIFYRLPTLSASR